MSRVSVWFVTNHGLRFDLDFKFCNPERMCSVELMSVRMSQDQSRLVVDETVLILQLLESIKKKNTSETKHWLTRHWLFVSESWKRKRAHLWTPNVLAGAFRWWKPSGSILIDVTSLWPQLQSIPMSQDDKKQGWILCPWPCTQWASSMWAAAAYSHLCTCTHRAYSQKWLESCRAVISWWELWFTPFVIK